MTLHINRKNLLCVCVAVLSGCRVPSQRGMTLDFARHEAEFEKLRTMFAEDTRLTAVGRNWVRSGTIALVSPPEKIERVGLTRERYDRYVKIFDALGIEAGVSRDEKGGIWFETTRPSLFNGDTREGYVYSPSPLTPLVIDLESYVPPATDDSPRPRFLVFKVLKGNWYLFKNSG